MLSKKGGVSVTEDKEKKIGIAAEIGGVVTGLTLIIWSINIAILSAGGINQSLLPFAFLFPPLGLYIAVTSAVDILRVIRKE